MDYSVIIVTRNRSNIIGKAIDSVLKQTIKPKEFIVIDNNSKDGTVEILLKYKKKYSFFKIYQMKVDLGVCKEINLGVKMVDSPVILIMDDDAILINEDWMEIALKNLRNDVGVIWGNIGGILDRADYKEAFGEFFNGCAFVIPKDIFQKVGMFDEKLFIYSNDTDLSIRLNMYGYRVLPVRKIRVSHPIGTKSPKFIEFASSNRLLIYWKYYPYWVSFIMTLLHTFQELRKMKNYSLLKFWLKGIKRFFTKLYYIGLSSKERMNMKEFFKYSYQLRFPSIGYKLVKLIYGI